MSTFPTITVGLSVVIDGQEEVSAYFREMGRRAARKEIAAILKPAMAPVVAAERGNIHSESGALSVSLGARTGSGDRPDTVSVFSAPTATRKQLEKTWHNPKKGRKQQQSWRINAKGRTRVFYGPMVELGHRIVRGGKVVGQVDPHPFAAPALGVLEAEGEAVAEAVTKHLLGDAA